MLHLADRRPRVAGDNPFVSDPNSDESASLKFPVETLLRDSRGTPTNQIAQRVAKGLRCLDRGQCHKGTSINWFFGRLASQMRRPMQDGGLHRPGGL
jgi:hypothetical protein